MDAMKIHSTSAIEKLFFTTTIITPRFLFLSKKVSHGTYNTGQKYGITLIL
jgi:hypothetical protein